MLEARSTITEGGRLLIPASIRKALHLKVGEEVILKVDSGALHVFTYENAIKQAQTDVRLYNKKQLCLSGALLKERREESSHEK